MSSEYKVISTDLIHGRTLIETDASEISEIKNLEQDLFDKDLFDESQRSIEKRICEKTLSLLKWNLDNGFLGNSCEPKNAYYRDLDEGIDVYFQDYVFPDEGKDHYNPGVKPSLNIQINEDKSLSLQLAFDRQGPLSVLRDILDIHASVTEEYVLSENSDKNLIINPVNKGAFFLETAKRLYQRLESSTIHEELLALRKESDHSSSEAVNQTLKRIYAREILEFLDVDF